MEATSSSLPYNPVYFGQAICQALVFVLDLDTQTFYYWPSAAYSTLLYDQIIYYKAHGYKIAHMHSN